MHEQTWLDVVKSEFESRQKDGKRFSLRAFARMTGVAPSTVSSIMNGQRRMTPKIALRIADGCEFSQERRELFLHLAVGPGMTNIVATKSDRDFRVLTDEELARVAHWHHYAILSLAELEEARFEAPWIARRLNITPTEAEGALQDLLQLGFIRVRGKAFVRRVRPVRSRSDTPSAIIRNFHAELMDKGANSLAKDPVSHRDITAITMPVNSRRLKAAKHKIKEFRRHLMDYLSKGQKNSVYAMQISLFPLTPIEDVGLRPE